MDELEEITLRRMLEQAMKESEEYKLKYFSLREYINTNSVCCTWCKRCMIKFDNAVRRHKYRMNKLKENQDAK
jgi:hypothetical protein